MRVRVQKWGKSAAVRIPAPIMRAATLSLGQTVEMRAEQGGIVIEPVGRREYELDSLLAGITDQNLHEAVDEGP